MIFTQQSEQCVSEVPMSVQPQCLAVKMIRILSPLKVSLQWDIRITLVWLSVMRKKHTGRRIFISKTVFFGNKLASASVGFSHYPYNFPL